MANPRFRKISRAQTSTTCVWPCGTEIQCRPGARFAHPTFLGGRARPSVVAALPPDVLTFVSVTRPDDTSPILWHVLELPRRMVTVFTHDTNRNDARNCFFQPHELWVGQLLPSEPAHVDVSWWKSSCARTSSTSSVAPVLEGAMRNWRVMQCQTSGAALAFHTPRRLSVSMALSDVRVPVLCPKTRSRDRVTWPSGGTWSTGQQS